MLQVCQLTRCLSGPEWWLCLSDLGHRYVRCRSLTLSTPSCVTMCSAAVRWHQTWRASTACNTVRIKRIKVSEGGREREREMCVMFSVMCVVFQVTAVPWRARLKSCTLPRDTRASTTLWGAESSQETTSCWNSERLPVVFFVLSFLYFTGKLQPLHLDCYL